MFKFTVIRIIFKLQESSKIDSFTFKGENTHYGRPPVNTLNFGVTQILLMYLEKSLYSQWRSVNYNWSLRFQN